MAKPTVRVRIAFTDGPYVASPTWTDVTGYVRNVNTSRGRTDDWQNFDTGNATVILDNRDRRFDPTYAAGPYFGNLLPRRQIRIDATTDNVTYYDVFRGYVDGWPVNLTDAGYDATTTVTCYDVLGLIAQGQLPTDWAYDITTSLTPLHYWRCNEADGATTLADSGSTARQLTRVAGTLASKTYDPLAPGLLFKSSNLNSGAQYQTDSTTTATTFTSLSFSMWIGLNNPAASSLLFGGSNGTFFYTLATESTGAITFAYFNGANGFYTTSSITNLNTFVPRHIVCTMDGGSGARRIYVDGQDVTGSVTSAAAVITIPAENWNIYNNIYQEVAVYNYVLSPAQVANLYGGGIGAITETTTARFNRIIGKTSVPAAMYSPTGSPAGTVAKITTGGSFVGTELQLTSDSEGGELYTSRAGVLTMTNRTYFATGRSLTNQATFGVGGIPIGTEMSYYWSADGIRNYIDIMLSGEANVTATDSTSIAAYGASAETYETVLATLPDAQNLGTYLVGFGKLPRLIMSAVEVNQALSAAQWVTVLGLDLLDRITVVVDEQVGSDLTQKQLIQQIEHDITPGDWRTRILGSSRWSSVFIIGESLIGGTDLLI